MDINRTIATYSTEKGKRKKKLIHSKFIAKRHNQKNRNAIKGAKYFCVDPI